MNYNDYDLVKIHSYFTIDLRSIKKNALKKMQFYKGYQNYVFRKGNPNLETKL